MPLYHSSWFSKFFECIYLFIVVSMTILMIPGASFALHINFNGNSFVSHLLIFFIVAVTLSVVYSIWWHVAEEKENSSSATKHAFLRGFLRYFTAFEVSTYGFAKIFRTQFVIPYSLADKPVNSLTGFQLTWNYFGYSHTFAVILGLFQIGGAVLLLFRRTNLLGVFILLPVMVNVVFINIFYSIALGAFINSLVITFALIYLLFLRWTDLKSLFFTVNPELAKINSPVLKSIAKVLAIGTAFGIVYFYVATNKQPYFTGKWSVNAITRNGKPVKAEEWQSDAMIWSNVYFEQRAEVILSPNPYIYEASRATDAIYNYDTKNRLLTLSYPGLSKKPNTDTVAVSNYDGKSMQWKLIHHSDTLRYNLSKVKTIY